MDIFDILPALGGIYAINPENILISRKKSSLINNRRGRGEGGTQSQTEQSGNRNKLELYKFQR